jgi:hypothetical protein
MKRTVISLVLAVMVIATHVAYATQPAPQPVNQQQTQGQGQMQYQNVTIRPLVTQPSNLPTTPDVYPASIPILASTIGTYPAPLFANKLLTPFDYKKDVIVSVIDVFNGGWFTNINLEELEVEMLSKAALIADKVNGQENKVRVMVQYKGSSYGAGVGGGGSAANMLGNGSVGTGAILPGYNTSTYDPKFILKFVIIQ